MPYRTLDKTKIIETAETLELRVAERFPDSSLSKVGLEIKKLAQDLALEASKLERPIWWLRLFVFGSIFLAALVFAQVGTIISFERLSTGALDFVQGIEAAINTAVFAGVGIYTLATLEERFKRRRALNHLHALRSIIHIIDMHQLTKDPVAGVGELKPTKSSPKRSLSGDELKRYLDYCSEMLSITGKIAALFAQALNDSVVVEAVNDIENLSANLSRKIWQKIMLVPETKAKATKVTRPRKKA